MIMSSQNGNKYIVGVDPVDLIMGDTKIVAKQEVYQDYESFKATKMKEYIQSQLDSVQGYQQRTLGTVTIPNYFGLGGTPVNVQIPTPSHYTDANKFLPKFEQGFRSTLQEVVDELFTQTEKEQFLIDLGYQFFKSNKGVDVFSKDKESGPFFNAYSELDSVFFNEIKGKLKSVLLTKQVLKFKI
jgi:hypothetical protein